MMDHANARASLATSIAITELQNLQKKLEREAKSNGMTPHDVEVSL